MTINGAIGEKNAFFEKKFCRKKNFFFSEFVFIKFMSFGTEVVAGSQPMPLLHPE